MTLSRRLHFSTTVFVACILFLPISCRQSSFDDECEKEAREYTEKKCPQKIMDGVVMDSLSYSRTEKCMSYFYTLSGELDNPEIIRENSSAIKSQLLEAIKNSVELKRAKDAGVAFRYVYISMKTHKQIVSMKIDKSEYLR